MPELKLIAIGDWAVMKRDIEYTRRAIIFYEDNLARMALPARLSFDLPSSLDIHAPISAIFSTLIPVPAPRLCKQYTRSSVAILPVAPFE